MSRNNSESREVGSGQISPSLMLNIEGESNEKEIQTISTAIDVMARRRIGLGLVLVGFGVLGIETFEYVRGEYLRNLPRKQNACLRDAI